MSCIKVQGVGFYGLGFAFQGRVAYANVGTVNSQAHERPESSGGLCLCLAKSAILAVPNPTC